MIERAKVTKHAIACGTGEQFAKDRAGRFPTTGVERAAVFGSDCNRRTVRSMSTELQRTCSSCGNQFSGTMEFCAVCMLHKALAGGAASGESSFQEAVKPTPETPVERFEHYELVTGDDGKPVELGRGGMGVTYKAFDVDLRCPVTLKVRLNFEPIMV